MSKDELLSKLRDDSELRRQTFIDKWPSSKSYLSIDEFVRQGFYCVGEGDKVQCVYCKGNLKSWAENDDILLEHRKHFPQCPFILQPYHFPEFRDYRARLDTLKDWPQQLSQKPEDIARAGMFYMGKGDQTQCFWCRGVLMDWEPDDVPILEHEKYFKNCQWLSAIKDSPFYKEAKKKKNSKGACGNQVTTNAVQETISPEVQVKYMGFQDDVIQRGKERAKESCGASFSVESLLKAILELEEVKTCEVKQTGEQESIDMKMLSSQKSASFDPSCKICMDADFNVVFLPCGHLLCCEKCAKTVRFCPMCRAKIDLAKKVFM